MNSLGRFLNIGILSLLLLGLILLAAATNYRMNVEDARHSERIKLAAVAAKQSFEQEVENFDKQIQRASSWLEHGHGERKNRDAFVAHFSPELQHTRFLRTSRIAFENGSQFILTQDRGSIWNCFSNGKDSTDCLPLPNSSSLFSTLSDTTVLNDSRGKDWFSKAIDNSGRTSWSFSSTAGKPLLVGCKYAEKQGNSGQLSVFAFEYDLEKIVSQIRKVPSRIEGIAVLRLPDGTIVYPSGEGANVELRKICETSSAISIKDTYNNLFDVEVDGLSYKAAVHELTLPGSNPSILSIVPQQERSFFRSMNGYIVGGFMLILGLGTLLFLGWYKSNVDARKIKMHETRSKTQQRKLKQVIGEREVLDREVHHRVKNNLQIISSILNMQLLKLPEDEPMTEKFRSNKKRIESIGNLHNALYNSKDLRGIDLQDFFEALANWIRSEFSPPGVNISYEVKANGLKTDMDTARDIGMIVSELMINAYQHAFPHATGGHVDVELIHEKRHRYRLSVHDNGIGMGAELLDRDQSTKMGLDIVDLMVEGLEGTFSYYSDEGVKCEALLRILPREPSIKPL